MIKGIFFRGFCASLFIICFCGTHRVNAREILVEGKASYFLSTNHRFRDIYGGAGLYRLETNIQVWRDLYAWVDLGYMYASGHSSLGAHTHLHLVPLSDCVEKIRREGLIKIS